MSLREIPYVATVIKDDSEYAAEGAATDSDKVRIVRGKFESQEGFERRLQETVSGKVRGGWTWADENGRQYIAAGTSSGLYTVVSNRIWDITPERETNVFATSTYASVTSGSDQVVLTFSGEHGAKNGDKIHLWNTSSVGGVDFGGYTSGFTSIGVSENSYTSIVTVSNHGLSNGDFIAIDSSTALTIGGYQFNGSSGSVNTDGISTVSGSEAVKLNVSNHGLYAGDLVDLAGSTAVGGITLSGLYYVEFVDDANNFYVQSSNPATSTASGGGASGTYDGTRVFRVRDLNADQLLIYIDTPATETTSGGAGVGFQSARAYNITTSGLSQAIITGSGTATSTTSGGGASARYQWGLAGGRINSTGTGYGTGTFGTGAFGTYSGGANLQELEARVWNMDNFGTFLVASPRGGKVYLWPLNPSRRAGWLTNAPAVNYAIGVTQERVLLSAGCTNTDGVFDPMLVRNSDIILVNTWLPDFDNNAGEQRLGTGSEMVQIQVLESGVLTWSDTAAYFGSYTGNNDQLYRFRNLGRNTGLYAPFAFVEQDGQAYWINDQLQFFTFTGGRPRQIPNPNRDWFEENLDAKQKVKIWCALDTKYGAAVWHFPTRNTVQPGEVDTYLRFDFNEAGQNPLVGWSVGTYQRTTWLPATVFGNPIAFDWDGVVYSQNVGQSAEGGNLTKFVRFAPIDSSSPETGDGTFKLAWTRVVLGSKLSDSTTLQIYFYTREWPNSAENTKGPYTYLSTTRFIDPRLQARQIAMEVRSVGTNDDWRLGTIRGDLRQGPRR